MSDSQKRLRSTESGKSINAAEMPCRNGYTGFTVPKDNFTIHRIPVSSVTPEEFHSKYVCTRTPVVLTGALLDEHFTALRKWSLSNDRLKELMGGGDTKLAIERRGDLLDKFGKGIKVEMTFGDFLQLLEAGNEMHYLTTQEVLNDENGRPEVMTSFMKKLQPDFPLRPKLLGHLIPQNINLWMGSSKHATSSGLHHDHHDNLYVLLRGTKHFRLYSPADATNLYPRGQMSQIHFNGLINYVGKETTPYGADIVAERETLAAFETSAAEWELAEAEKAMEKGVPGAVARLQAAEDRLEKAMLHVLHIDKNEFDEDENVENGTFHFEESDSEGNDDSEMDELDTLDIKEHEMKTFKRQVSEVEVTYPENFSQVDLSRLSGSEEAQQELHAEYPHFCQAKAAICELEAGEMLYLPASWFHEVKSLNSTQNYGHMALNYWYHPPDQLTPEFYASPYSSPLWQLDWEERFVSNKEKGYL
ncbi:hypothetical protein CCR75_005375 [Bremia lactucae]|uniref:JmjC domain-containing protein n=1 Tax=Bremia lactucae TaxID=4779 RepID=A0A976IBM8_BRELC|nr:hypothetical protein CCR75_005375 [Bremia lactucae]